MSELVFTILAAVFFVLGALSIVFALTGVFRFRFVMNRMHCAAVIDTLGLTFIILGLMCLSGDMNFIPKLFLILILQAIGSPIASHMVAKLEVRTDEEISEHLKFEKEDTEEKS